MGKTAVCGAESLDVDTKGRIMTTEGGVIVKEGDVLSINGSDRRRASLGEVPVVASDVVIYFESGLEVALGTPTSPRRFITAVDRVMTPRRRERPPSVRANADTPPTPPAPGNGRRGHRPAAHRAHVPRRAEDLRGELLHPRRGREDRKEALEALLPLQRKDFIGIFEAMDGLPVTIRLIDPPLHEFLPNLTELAVRVALAEARGESVEADLRLLQAVNRLHEQNPMLGLRGVRLGLVLRGLFALQVRAIAEAACFRQRMGGRPAGGDHDPARGLGARARPGRRTRPPGCSRRSPMRTGAR